MIKSTNDRSKIPFPVRAVLSTLSRIAPWTTPGVVERVFFTPPKGRPSARALEALATGERRTLTLDGEPVAYWLWPGSGPTVALLHGWAGSAAQLTSFVPPLREAGYRVVAIDAPGHGASGGRRSNLLRFSRALRATSDIEGPLHAVIAHSLGGTAAAHAIHVGLKLSRAVFIGSPADIDLYFRDFLANAGVPRNRHDMLVATLERRFDFRWHEIGIDRIGPAMKTPLLVVHDTGDEEIPWNDGALVARSWPGAQLVSTSGLGHRRILRDPEVVRLAVAFVAAEHATKETRMNTSAHPSQPDSAPAFLPRCAQPGCPNRVVEAWEETGKLCARCAIEGELFDRDLRMEMAQSA